jgi:fatty acid desaturase
MSALSSSYFNVLHRGHHIRLHRGLGAPGHHMDNINPYEVQWLKRLFAWNGVVFGFAMICLRGLTFKMESINFVRRNWNATRIDRFMMLLHFVLWLVVPVAMIGLANAIVNYSAITLIGGLYIGTVLVLNHEGMSKVDTLSQLPLLDRTLASTRDLGGSWLTSIILGGVNNHIEHHLFPTIPIVRLGQARRITEAFLRQNGMPHVSANCPSALKSAFGYFRSISPENRVTHALS